MMIRKCKRKRDRMKEYGKGFESFWGHEPTDVEIVQDIRGLFNMCEVHTIFWSPIDYLDCPMCYDGIKPETTLE